MGSYGHNLICENLPEIKVFVTSMDKPAGNDCFQGYEVIREAWEIGGRTFQLARPADMDSLLDLPETRERFEKDGYMPYWADLWPSAVMLAEFVLIGPSSEGIRAVELGCGIGLVSIAAAMRGMRVTATDYDEDALEFARRNAEMNGAVLEDCRLLDYREDYEGPGYEVILGADLLYEKEKCEPLARWIAQALADEGRAFICDPHRAAADGFSDRLQEMGFEVKETAVSGGMPDGKTAHGRIWSICHR
jgi:predicted nicotinamide N-methyase